MKKNSGVKCDVTSCTHNIDGADCNLKEIFVEYDNGDNPSVCGSFDRGNE